VFNEGSFIQLCIDRGIATKSYPYSEAVWSDIHQYETHTDEIFPWAICGVEKASVRGGLSHWGSMEFTLERLSK
jgi:hypothetical protein